MNISHFIYGIFCYTYVYFRYCKCFFFSSYFSDINMLQSHFPYQLTIFKKLQIIDICEQYQIDEYKIGYTTSLNIPSIGFFKNGKEIGTVSLCRCCFSIGWTEQKINRL